MAVGEAAETEDDDELRLGPFVATSRLVVSEAFDDNVFSTRNRKVSDFITLISPELELEARAADYRVQLSGGAEIGRYRDSDSEDYQDYFVGGEGRYRVSDTSDVFGGVTYQYEHEERESPDDVNGIEPTIYDDLQAFVGTANRFGAVNTRIGATFQRLDFSDVAGTAGLIDNDDRDRSQYTAGGRIGYQLTPRHEIFTQAAADVRAYRAARDNLGLDRDSQGYNAAVGLRYTVSRMLEAEVLAGYMAQDYDDADLKSIGAWDASALLDWRVAPNTTFSGFFDRTIEETTIDASGYVNTGIGASVEHLLRPDLSAESGVAYYISQYYGNARQDEIIVFNLGGRYYLMPHLFVGLDFRHVQRDSNDPDEDYDDNLAFVRLGTQLVPRYDEDQLAGPGIPPSLAGFYVGVQGSFGKVGVEFEGDRGPVGAGGTLTSDFGNHGFGGGAFAGYGAVIGPAYLAVEASVEESEANWGHARRPDGREFGVHKGHAVSLGPVVGYLLPGGMAFARFDVVGARLDTEYEESGEVFDEEHFLGGLRFGVGADVPVCGGLFLRMDYAYTTYWDYDVVTRMSRVDNFVNNESVVHVGLGYRFGAGRTRSEENGFAADFSGVYVGAQTGYGALATRLRGPRDSGSALDADFADEGATAGGFVGYGHAFGALFVGVEAEAEISGHAQRISLNA